MRAAFRTLRWAPMLLLAHAWAVGAATLPGEEPPGWVLPPGREAVIEHLFDPYMDAPARPRVTGARIERRTVRATVELAAGQTVTVELQHADTETAAPVVAGTIELAATAGVDLRVVTSSLPSAPDAAAALRTVAQAIVANRRAHPVPLWEENSVKIAERAPKDQGHGEPPTHAGILTEKTQRLATFGAVGTGILAGLVAALRRRRQDRRSK